VQAFSDPKLREYLDAVPQGVACGGVVGIKREKKECFVIGVYTE
jgi:hypothetical protein